MQLSIQRLRWVLAAGALLLVAVLATYIGYGHYRMMSAYRRILARSGVTISHDSNGVTYSQSVGGKKIFTLRAAKETSLGNGKWTLHDADLLLYTRSAEHPDHIYGKDFEYDQNEGVARALGEVFMDLQAPDALVGNRTTATTNAKTAKESRGGREGTMPGSKGVAAGAKTEQARAEQAQVIHVRTSGLVYLRKLGVVATDRQVEFEYGGMQCTALGAEFNTGQNVLHLLAHVTMDGLAHGQPVHLTAVKADIDRTANVADLTQPVVVSQNRRAGDRTDGKGTAVERTARADEAVLDLRKDGSIEQAHGLRKVVLTSGTQQVTADRLDAALSPQTVPETARLSGDVLLVDTSEQRPMHGTARQVDAVFDAKGAPANVVATGGANLSMVEHANPVAGAHGLARQMQGEKIVALFVPITQRPGPQKSGSRASGSRLSEIHATGAARMRGESLVAAKSPANAAQGKAAQTGLPQFKTVQVAADDLKVSFAAAVDKQVEPQKLYGNGHTLLQQDAPLGEQEISHGDTLDATFASAPGGQKIAAGAQKEELTVVSAVQAGHVTIYTQSASRAVAGDGAEGKTAAAGGDSSRVSTGSARRAVYDEVAQTLTLSGDTELESGNVSLSAPTVVLDQETGDAEAMGGVQATMLNASPAAQSGTEDAAGASAGGAGAGSVAANAKPAPVTHVLSASATFHHALKLSEFRGSDAEPARMWQDASQVQAAILLLDGVRHTFSARPASAGALVRAVFAGRPAPAKPNAARPGPGPEAGSAARGTGASTRGGGRAGPHPGAHAGEGGATDYVRVASPKMDYNELQREAMFSGGVQIDGTMGEVRGQRAVVFLTPTAGAGNPASTAKPAQAAPATPLNGSLDRVVVSGNVRMEQPDRHGTGAQLLYTAATDSYVLTGLPGEPPHIVDAQQGNVRGTTLLFGAASSTIVVAGEPGASKSGQGRVRTETEVRQ